MEKRKEGWCHPREAPVREGRSRGLGEARDGMDTGPKIWHKSVAYVPVQCSRPWVAVFEAWCRGERRETHTHRAGRRQSCGGERLQKPLPLPCPSAGCLTNRISCKRRRKVTCEPWGVAVHPHFFLEVIISHPSQHNCPSEGLLRANSVAATIWREACGQNPGSPLGSS